MLFSPETRHAMRDFSTVNLRTTMLNEVGVLIDHNEWLLSSHWPSGKFVRSNFEELGRAGLLATKVQSGPHGACCQNRLQKFKNLHISTI